MEIEIEFKGIKLLVSGTYTPPEEPVRYYNDMSGHPGSNSDFDINEIFVEGFQLARIPKQRLYTGRKQRIFETSLNKNKQYF